jgi:DNA repair protein RecO (recombination protein O)
MSIEKSCSIVLSTVPYRESSILMYLFSRQHGRIHALAKGIRKSDRRGVPVERGYLIEHIVYLKPHRDLHLVTDCQIREHYPAIRCDLDKTAVRDVLFDLLLAAIKVTDPHPELFDYLARFLTVLDGTTVNMNGLLLHLSKTLFGIAARLGFGIDFGRCVTCGTRFGENGGAWLSVEKGLVRCEDCSPAHATADRFLPFAAAAFFACPDELPLPAAAELTDREMSGVLRLTCDYCRYHFDIRKQLDSLKFIEHLFAMAGDAAGRKPER